MSDTSHLLFGIYAMYSIIGMFILCVQGTEIAEDVIYHGVKVKHLVYTMFFPVSVFIFVAFLLLMIVLYIAVSSLYALGVKLFTLLFSRKGHASLSADMERRVFKMPEFIQNLWE